MVGADDARVAGVSAAGAAIYSGSSEGGKGSDVSTDGRRDAAGLGSFVFEMSFAPRIRSTVGREALLRIDVIAVTVDGSMGEDSVLGVRPFARISSLSSRLVSCCN
jgi:hypothetical protein